MSDNPHLLPEPPDDVPPLDGAPTWVRILQAAVIGVVAGFALNAVVSMVTVQGEGLEPEQAAPKTCKKPAPAKEADVPAINAPTLSGVTWVLEGLIARR
ncbi:MAG: hypothetical protein ACRD15_18110 [Vicinamibacterales bacterium]